MMLSHDSRGSANGKIRMSTISIKADISIGEMIDKITILEIKQERIDDSGKLVNIRAELELLNGMRAESIPVSPELDSLKAKLKDINIDLWELEDDIRDHERNNKFGDSFIALARRVYKTNDKRALVKREINMLMGSTIIEEKSYHVY